MATAKLIKEMTSKVGALQKLYKLSPPLKHTDWIDDTEHEYKYVVVSAVVAMFGGPETYIFPANKKGEIVDFGELEGSYRGGMSHETALTNAGYSVNT